MSDLNLGRDSTVRVASHVLHRELDGESVLLNVESGVYYGLNETGSLVWSMLAESKDLGAVQDRLKDEFGVDANTVWDDLTDLIGELSDRNLVQVVKEGPLQEVASEGGEK